MSVRSSMAESDHLFTMDEAAAWLRVSRWSLYNLIRDGHLRTIRIGRRLVTHAALTECVEQLAEDVA